MKTSRFSTLAIASTLAVAFSFPALASAAPDATQSPSPAAEQSQDREGKRDGRQRHEHRHEHRHERHHGGSDHRHAFQELQLTQEQKDRWKELRQAAAPEMRQTMEDARKARQELRQLGRSGEFQLEKAEEIARRAAEPMTRLSVLRAKLDADFRNLLTPEQRSKLQAEEERRAEEFKKRAEERKARAQQRDAKRQERSQQSGERSSGERNSGERNN